eukprot:m51a1_g1326 hypothetical protein (324) ;mRNA; r:265656-266931
MMRTVIVVLCAVALASAFEFKFIPRNFSSLKPVDAHYHKTDFKPLSTVVTKGTWFYSLNADAAAHADHDTLNASAGASAEAIIASGAVAMVYEGLVECDSNGMEISTKTFMPKTLLGTTGMTWADDCRGENNGAKYYRIKGTDASSSLVVYFTWTISNVPGYSEYGNTVLVPKGFETIVEIHDYPYTDKSNKLHLRILGANANAEAKAHALVSRNGVNAYAEARARATVNGVEAEAEATAWADYTLDALKKLAGGALAPFTNAWSNSDVKRIDIVFPAGAQVVVYDPVLGSGTSPYAVQDGDGAASGVVPALAILVATVVALL